MTTPTDTAKLADEIEGLAKDATPGEWRQYRFNLDSGLIVIDGENPQRIAASGRTQSDAALIVALVNNSATIISALREVSALKEEVERLHAQDWLPIESAPKDGKTIMLWSKYHSEPVTAGWANGRWSARWDECSVIESQGDTWTDYKLADVPTHWQPLPPAPAQRATDE